MYCRKNQDFMFKFCVLYIMKICAQGNDDENADFQVLKKSIKDSISRQQYDSFTTLISAAKAGDVETIRDLLRCGADIDAVNYDGRSAFAMVNDISLLLNVNIRAEV